MFIFKEELTKENVFKRVTEYDIFLNYFGQFVCEKKYRSPWRRDSNPSFIITNTEKGLRCKDFGDGPQLDCIGFVQRLFNYSFYQALSQINVDFNLGLAGEHPLKSFSTPVITNTRIVPLPKKAVLIQETVREFNELDKEYWGQYLLDLEDLEDTKAISQCYIDDYVHYNYVPKLKNIAYCYYYEDKKKIYLPKATKYNKWRMNWNSSCIDGYNKLPESGDLLIITSSRKDRLVLKKLGYISIAPPSENTYISEEKIEELKRRFKKVVLYLNNDEEGIKFAKRQSEEYEIDYIHNETGEPKDPSDLVKKYKERGFEMIKKLIEDGKVGV
jgi:hypothetical protein